MLSGVVKDTSEKDFKGFDNPSTTTFAPLGPLDKDAPTASFTIQDSGSVSLTQPQIELIFSEPVDPAWVITNSVTNECNAASASVQLSLDNFASNTNCRPLGNPATSDNKTFTIIPINFKSSEPCPVKSNGSCSASLMPDTTYRLKVTTANRDFAGNLLKAETLQNFTTKGSPQPVSKIPDDTLERWSVRIQPSLTFDQNLDASSIDNKTVLLKPIPLKDMMFNCRKNNQDSTKTP